MAEGITTTDLKTPDEWQEITGITILDADGWGGKDGRPWTDKIGYVEWNKRMSRSTVQMKSIEQYREITKSLGG